MHPILNATPSLGRKMSNIIEFADVSFWLTKLGLIIISVFCLARLYISLARPRGAQASKQASKHVEHGSELLSKRRR